MGKEPTRPDSAGRGFSAGTRPTGLAWPKRAPSAGNPAGRGPTGPDAHEKSVLKTASGQRPLKTSRVLGSRRITRTAGAASQTAFPTRGNGSGPEDRFPAAQTRAHRFALYPLVHRPQNSPKRFSGRKPIAVSPGGLGLPSTSGHAGAVSPILSGSHWSRQPRELCRAITAPRHSRGRTCRLWHGGCGLSPPARAVDTPSGVRRPMARRWGCGPARSDGDQKQGPPSQERTEGVVAGSGVGQGVGSHVPD